MISVGVDYSTKKIAAASLYEGARLGPSMTHAIAGKVPLEESIELLIKQFAPYALEVYLEAPYEDGVSFAFEAPIVGASINKLLGVQMGAVCGALAAIAIRETRAKISIVPPSKWKKQVCGQGNLSKDGVMAWLEFTHPHLAKACSTDDDFDAMCLALYASQQEEAL